MKLEVKEGIKIKIHNKDISMGCHYPEDDWSIKAIAPTYEKAIELIIPDYILSDICPSNGDAYVVKYITYKGKNHVLEKQEEIAKLIHGLKEDIEKHPLFKKLSEEKQRKLKAAKIKKEIETKRKNEKSEKKLLEKLRKKYDK